MNNFVEIDFNSKMKTIICKFLNQPVNTTNECSFNVRHGPECDQLLGLYTNASTGDSVSSPELPLIQNISEYCFTVTARSNNVTVSVEGTLNLFEVSNDIPFGKTITDSVEKIIITLTVLFDNLDVTVATIELNTAAVIAPVVTASVLVVGGVVMTALLLLYYYLFRQSLIVIRFSNPDKPGSLALMLKVFKVI